MHKGTEHVGKFPQRAHREIELSDRMRTLTEDLQKAVQEENYETAASLRDQIKQLETRTGELKMKFSEFHGERRANGCAVKVRIIRSSSAAACGWRVIYGNRAFPGWAKKAERTADSGVDQAARGRAAGNAGFVFGIAPGSFGAGKASAGRAASDQPRARGQKCRQRRYHESPADAQHHGQ